MDLGAYVQIDDLGKIARDNNIQVPRLRGYRLMKDAEPVSKEEIKRIIKTCEITVCEDLCRARPFWCAESDCHSYSSWTDYLCSYYLITKTYENENGYKYTEYIDIRWDRIHGWKRKALKFAIKKKKRAIQKQIDMWNKYVGKDNVLFIHSRIGGANWNDYGGNELEKQPWFLEKVDDYFDDTYCDIYALIK